MTADPLGWKPSSIVGLPFTSGSLANEPIQIPEADNTSTQGLDKSKPTSDPRHSLKRVELTGEIKNNKEGTNVDITNAPLYFPFGATPLTHGFLGIFPAIYEKTGSKVAVLVEEFNLQRKSGEEVYPSDIYTTYELVLDPANHCDREVVQAEVKTSELLQSQFQDLINMGFPPEKAKDDFSYDGSMEGIKLGRLRLHGNGFKSLLREESEVVFGQRRYRYDCLEQVVQLFVEDSIKRGFEGRVIFDANFEEAIKLEKIGFQAVEVKEFEERKKNGIGQNFFSMYLSSDAINRFLERPRILREVSKEALANRMGKLPVLPLERPKNIFSNKFLGGKKFRVAIIDSKENDILLSPYLGHYVSHGTFVKAVLEAFAPPNTKFTTYEIPSFSFSHFDELINAAEQIKRDGNYDAVNLSYGGERFADSMKYSGIHGGLTRINFHKNREEIKKSIAQHLNQPGVRKYGNLDDLFIRFDEIEMVPIFVAAGNKGPYDLNPFLLFKNSRGVGALDLSGRKTIYSGDNQLVTEWAQGDYPVKTVFKNEKMLGYSIFNDDKVDIPIDIVTQGEIFDDYKNKSVENDHVQLVQGTSGAAPRALAEYLWKALFNQ